MLITCPKCKARYEVSEASFADGPREVQCGSCQTVWRQVGPPRRVSPAEGRAMAEEHKAATRAREAAFDEEEDEEDAPAAAAPPPPRQPPGPPPRQQVPGLNDAARILKEMQEERKAGQGISLYDDPPPRPAQGADSDEDDEAIPSIGRRQAAEEAHPATPGAAAAAGAAAAGAGPARLKAPPAQDDDEWLDDEGFDEWRAGDEEAWYEGPAGKDLDEDEEEEATRRKDRRPTPAAGTKKRDHVLPDAAALNQSLLAAERDEAAQRRRPRFWRGFFLALLICAIAFAVYAFRAPIAAQFPQAEAPLERYAERVGALRLWGEGQAHRLVDLLGDSAVD